MTPASDSSIAAAASTERSLAPRRSGPTAEAAAVSTRGVSIAATTSLSEARVRGLLVIVARTSETTLSPSTIARVDRRVAAEVARLLDGRPTGERPAKAIEAWVVVDPTRPRPRRYRLALTAGVLEDLRTKSGSTAVVVGRAKPLATTGDPTAAGDVATLEDARVVALVADQLPASAAPAPRPRKPPAPARTPEDDLEALAAGD